MSRPPSQEPAPSPRADESWRLDAVVRGRRLREQGRRSLAENLAEGLALSEYLTGFTGAARK